MRAFTLMIPLLCLLLIGCGGNSDSDSAGSDSASSNAASSDTPSADSKQSSSNGPDEGDGFDPCTLLSESLIRSHFEVGEAEIAPRSSVQRRYSTCLVSWPKLNDAELQAEFQEKVKEYGMAMAKGQDAEMPTPPRHCEISLTVPNKRFDDAAQAQSALDSGLDILKHGLKTRPKDPARVAEINIQPLEGLGDKAAWTTPQNQISVANDRRIFHLNVNIYDDSETNRAKAVELAKLFLKGIH